ncbi:5-formyltetrahydrofolate cyclo-ligase [Microbacterium halotolerans]|uniref:5-formyltetrahydrofolate cyclo-ligase n=1 Tax=Microbacterium halotolerans TaxID=246613 RepID=UPI000E6A9B84|nr:5-formyltetrahydrofolate cyclo-ligase [Microbacterium halotolerans]
MADEARHAKRALRAQVRERRRALAPTRRQQADAGFTEQLEALVAAHSAASVSCYLSSPTEPGTRGFLAASMGRGLRILLPISRGDGVLDWTVADPDGDEVETALGVPEAVGEALGPLAVHDVDLMFVPAAAVDREGWRMGWGRGYYDTTLASLANRPPIYAVIYDSELVDAVPREMHDQPVTGVVTPTRTITFAR